MSLRAIGIGDNVVDRYLHTALMYPGGNALNFSVYAGMCGAKAAYLGRFGDDSAATYLRQTLAALSVDTIRCRSYPGENGYADVRLESGDRVFVRSNKGGVNRNHPWNFTEEDLIYIGSFDLIHTSLNSYIEEELPLLRSTHVPLSFDFSNRWNDEYLARVCPYADFAFLSCGHLDKEIRRAEMEKAASLGSTYVIATMGEQGAELLYRDSWYHQDAIPVAARDTMGAGDAFLTGFLVALFRHCRERAKLPLGLMAGEDDGAIREGLGEGAHFAAHICGQDGAFGHGVPFSVSKREEI